MVLRDSEILGRLREAQSLGTEGTKSLRFFTRAPALGDSDLLPTLQRYDVQVLLRHRRNELLCVSSRPA